MSPVAPPLIDELRAVAVRLFAYLCGIAGLAIMTAEVFQPRPSALPEPIARPDWMTVERPSPAFEISLPEIGEEASYTIRRHVVGGGRKDILTFGTPGRSPRFAMVEIYRPGTELSDFPAAADTVAAHATPFGLTAKAHVSLPLETKFGPVETVDLAVGRFGGGHCVGFVRNMIAPHLRISGLSCSMIAIVDRADVDCLLDRLTLLSAGGDPRVAEVFARAEVNRKFCRQREHLMYATPKRPTPPVLPSDHSSVRLRGTLASR